MVEAPAKQLLSLSLASIVAANESAISTDLDGEVVILDTSKGVYYGLDAVGATIWSQIQQSATLETVRDAVLQEYDVDPATCERDLMALIQNLSSSGLVRIEQH